MILGFRQQSAVLVETRNRCLHVRVVHRDGYIVPLEVAIQSCQKSSFGKLDHRSPKKRTAEGRLQVIGRSTRSLRNVNGRVQRPSPTFPIIAGDPAWINELP